MSPNVKQTPREQLYFSKDGQTRFPVWFSSSPLHIF